MTEQVPSEESNLRGSAERGFFSWTDMFAQVCQRHSGQRIAEVIGVSEQYVSDLRRGMRRPTVEITDKLCDWMGRGPEGRREWHKAGARAHGWRV